MELLEKYNLAAAGQLRIEVYNGVVVVAGEVASAYDKQLISHFCRQVPGVVKYVDGILVREPAEPKSSTKRRPVKKPARDRGEWRPAFQSWQLGAALGLVVMACGALSLGRGTSGPARLAVHPIVGELRFEGQPAAGAAIILHPQDPSNPVRPRASVNADGTFAVTTYEHGDGAPAGLYKATAEWRRPTAGGGDEPGPNVLPPAYAGPKSTPLEITVVEGENEFPPIVFQK